MRKYLVLFAALLISVSHCFAFAAPTGNQDPLANALKELEVDAANKKAGILPKKISEEEGAAIMRHLYGIRAELKDRRPELSKALIEKWAPKILADIDFIMKKGWADKIDISDFFHVHLTFPYDKVSADYVADGSEVIFLYHTREGLKREPVVANRDIVSSLGSEPTALNVSADTVEAWNLKCWEFGFVAWDKDKDVVRRYAVGYEVDASARAGGLLLGLMSPPLL